MKTISTTFSPALKISFLYQSNFRNLCFLKLKIQSTSGWDGLKSVQDQEWTSIWDIGGRYWGSNVLTLRCRGRCSDSLSMVMLQFTVPWYMVWCCMGGWYGMVWPGIAWYNGMVCFGLCQGTLYGGVRWVGGPGTGWHPLNLLHHCLAQGHQKPHRHPQILDTGTHQNTPVKLGHQIVGTS